MPEQKESPVVRPMLEILAIAGSMAAIFGVFSLTIPASLFGPVLALLLGLVITGVFLKRKSINYATAIATWIVPAVLILFIYMLVSRPATVVGRVVDVQNAPLTGARLVLTDSSGVDHKTVTDEEGAFEFHSIPQGKYLIMVESELLTSSEVPSGWQRIFSTRVKLPASVYRPSATNTPVASPDPAMTDDPSQLSQPTTLSTLTPTVEPYLGCRIEDFEGARKVNWFSPDPQVFSYAETDLRAHSGTYSFRVVYHKTDTYQYVAAANVGCCFPRGVDQELRVWVYGAVKLLVKLEDQDLRQAEIGIKEAVDPEGWTLLTFDYSSVKSQVNLGRLKTILFFPAPGDPLAAGEFLLDDIELYPYDGSSGSCPQ
ncbi:MAG: carboxypeptidase regulatory-like domain-containing protein [Chloroflexi bacterium]|nr:carboxypeptidase regulatory-like domain-containing protein [Chloroflexota bacterium]